MPQTPGRDAAATMLTDDTPLGEPEGFTFVEIVIGLLIVGIIAAIAVFAVAQATHHSTATVVSQSTTTAAKSAEAKCDDERAQVDLAVAEYKSIHKVYPASLDVLVAKGLLDSVPSETSPSHAAGFRYHPKTGKYSGGTCPS